MMSPLKQISKEKNKKYGFHNNWPLLNIYNLGTLLILFHSNAKYDSWVWENDKLLPLEDPFFTQAKIFWLSESFNHIYFNYQ